MSSIRQALAKLDQAVSTLEQTAAEVEQKTRLSGKMVQPDMFPETRNLVAQRLDTVIAQVETMLEKA